MCVFKRKKEESQVLYFGVFPKKERSKKLEEG